MRYLLQPLTKTTLKSKESQVVDHLHQSTEIRHFFKIGIFQLVQRVSKLSNQCFFRIYLFSQKNIKFENIGQEWYRMKLTK